VRLISKETGLRPEFPSFVREGRKESDGETRAALEIQLKRGPSQTGKSKNKKAKPRLDRNLGNRGPEELCVKWNEASKARQEKAVQQGRGNQTLNKSHTFNLKEGKIGRRHGA